jgi:pimeloyl-ACP methyl ester carboxylesterase
VELVKTKSFTLAVNSKGDPKSKKLAICLPGRLDTKDYECFNKHIQLLSSKRFYAIAVDPPGTWESPGATDLFTTSNYIKAVNELIEYYGSKPTLLLGHSRGGAVATLAGCPNKFVNVLVLINPSLGAPTPPDKKTLKTGVYIDYRDFPPGAKKTKKQKKFIAHLGYFKDGNKYDDAEVLRTCTKSKLIFYSTRDEFARPTEVEKLLKKVPPPKVVWKINSTHDYRYFPKIVEFINDEIGRFIEKD